MSEPSTYRRTQSTYRRILRRETHSPRSVLAITVAVVLIVALLYLGTEIVLAMIGTRALLAAPLDMLDALAHLDDAPDGLVVGVGVGLLLIGALLIIGAATPGRRGRHQMSTERGLAVVDDEVIASALARHAAHAGDVDPDNTTVSVSRRVAGVHLVPTSGTRIRRDAVISTVAEQLEAFDLTPSLEPRIVVAERGRVGA